MERKHLIHTIEPVFNQDSKVLLLGTFPSPKSREVGFYYSHPRNRFWSIIADLCFCDVPITKDEKMQFLLAHKIALWDVLQSCSIQGADDTSIREPVANPIHCILQKAPIKAIFTTGSKAAVLYEKYCLPKTRIQAFALPSTSPANCRITYDDLKQAYAVILPYLQ